MGEDDEHQDNEHGKMISRSPGDPLPPRSSGGRQVVKGAPHAGEDVARVCSVGKFPTSYGPRGRGRDRSILPNSAIAGVRPTGIWAGVSLRSRT